MSRLIVTGAASGIGAEVARQATDAGWQVAGFDRSSIGARSAGQQYTVDVRDPHSIASAVADATRVWGGPPDALVHCAGIYRVAAAAEMDTDAWEETLSINARGTFVVAREVAAVMRRFNSTGSLVLLSSVAALRGDATEPCAAYSASKGAVSALVRQFAVEWGKAGIRVNAVTPGVIDTAMTTLVDDPAATAVFLEHLPLSRLGRAEEVAAACMFLAGPSSSYITGTEIVVDGGYLVS